MYPINKRKLPRVKDDVHFMYGILRAINEHFCVSAELLEVSPEKYNNYYVQLEREGYIERVVQHTDNIPENFNITLEGGKVLKSNKWKMRLSHTITTPLGKTTLEISKQD